MPHYVLVAPLVPLAVGDGFTFSAWPLHVTVVSNFATELPLDQVTEALATSARPMDVVAGNEAMFGPRENIRVALVEHSDELVALHAELVSRLRELEVEFDNPGYLGAGYRPHVTETRFAEVARGDRLRLTQLALVDMAAFGDAGLRRVVWTTDLRD